MQEEKLCFTGAVQVVSTGTLLPTGTVQVVSISDHKFQKY
jgi:hypothetical protein